MDGHGAINDTARALFAPLGGDYDRWATILSFAQDPRWRRFLVEHVPVGPDARVLDVATGTGAIARGLVRRYGCRVVGVDQSPQMLDGARERIEKAGLADRIELRLGSAEELDFAEGSFDALTTGYLLRYLDDPLRTMSDAGAARAARRAVRAARLRRAAERRRARPLARLYRRRPAGAGPPGLAGLGRGRALSATEHHRLRRHLSAGPAAGAPTEAGGANVQTRLLSLGGGLVAWGVRAVR